MTSTPAGAGSSSRHWRSNASNFPWSVFPRLSAADAQATWAESYASDMPLADTIYNGGVVVADGKPGWVIVDLSAGNSTLALTPQALEGDEAPPVSTLLPLMAMGEAAAAAEEIPAAVAARVTEFAFVSLKDKTLPARRSGRSKMPACNRITSSSSAHPNWSRRRMRGTCSAR